ncbi:MAG: cation:proton antiporter, partial [Bacteroidota bacterium]
MEEGAYILITLGLLLSTGFVVGHYAEQIGIPRAATYVAVGALFSEALVGRIFPTHTREWDPLLIDTALGAVAFLVGAEVQVEKLKRLGKTIVSGAVGQSIGALLVVGGSTMLFAIVSGTPLSWTVAFVFGALATATAPAATIAVIEEYNA